MFRWYMTSSVLRFNATCRYLFSENRSRSWRSVSLLQIYICLEDACRVLFCVLMRRFAICFQKTWAAAEGGEAVPLVYHRSRKRRSRGTLYMNSGLSAAVVTELGYLHKLRPVGSSRYRVGSFIYINSGVYCQQQSLQSLHKLGPGSFT